MGRHGHQPVHYRSARCERQLRLNYWQRTANAVSFERWTTGVTVVITGAATGIAQTVYGDYYNYIQNVTGSQYADTLTAAPGGSTLMGLVGNDTLIGGPGNDVLEGGAGADVLSGPTALTPQATQTRRRACM